jgi:hypothetical protein
MSALQAVNGIGQAIAPAEIINPNTPLPASRIEAVEASFFEKAVCLTLTIGRFGNTRKAPLTSVEVRADKSRLRLSKQLLVSPELDEIESYDNGLRSWVQSRCLPMPGVFKGSYLLPLGAIEEVNGRLGRAEKIERPVLIDEFCQAYPDKVQLAQAELGDLFDPADYPGPNRLRAMFYLDYRYFTLSTPSKLRDFSVVLFQQERDKAARLWQETMEEGRQFLRGLMLELVKHARERLEPGPDGKPRVFRNSLVNNLNEFLDSFRIRNIGDDTELAGLVDQMRGLATGVVADDLRTSDSLRQSWTAELGRIETSLSSMIIEKPTRQIRFDD